MRAQPRAAAADNTPMMWHDLDAGDGVLELRGPPGLELELRVFMDVDRVRCVWLWSQSGAVAWWPSIGVA